jgi:ferredoxin
MTGLYLCGDQRVDLDDEGLNDIIWVDELCERPSQLIGVVGDEQTELVVGIHRDDANIGNLQASLRRLGFDPLGVGVVDLDAAQGHRDLRVAIAAAVARVESFPGTAGANVKMLAPIRKTRRDLLVAGAPRYVGAPSIDTSTCAARDGCRICVTECPSGALSWNAGNVGFDINTCVACGICVSACPTGATSNPSVDPGSFEAQVRAIVDAAGEDVGIRFRCRDGVVPPETGWAQLEVPCTGMLTLGWLLAPLALGAGDVDAIPCERGGCRLGNDAALADVMDDLKVVVSAASDVLVPDEVQPFAPRSTAALVAAALLPEQIGLDFVSAPVGMIAIDKATCTACEMCATICPTSALISDPATDGVVIEFDPRLCVGCGQCVTTCPELAAGAISLSRRFDPQEWVLGRRTVREEKVPVCEICGGPVAPAAMLERVREMLADDGEETMALISRRCVYCRGR